MPGFKFELSQLVMVPGKNQQGRISGRMEFVNDETVYQVKWLADDLTVETAMFQERELRLAQFDAVPDLVIDWNEVKAAADAFVVGAGNGRPSGFAVGSSGADVDELRRNIGPTIAHALRRKRRRRKSNSIRRSARKTSSAKKKARG